MKYVVLAVIIYLIYKFSKLRKVSKNQDPEIIREAEDEFIDYEEVPVKKEETKD